MTAPKVVTGVVVTQLSPEVHLTAEAHGTTLLLASTDHTFAATLNESAAEEFAAEVAEAMAAIKSNARVSYVGRASSGETLDTTDREVAGRWAFDQAQADNVVAINAKAVQP
ncbi:hypothetical protein [Mycobacteroides abscessus]|uniref:hypothetical protein n=1 Tax=Mycobacteroides abscessus TaxID=36809 RepID=UPI00187882A2|nr:hypothetical protein [Mycobacteroides abscessus]